MGFKNKHAEENLTYEAEARGIQPKRLFFAKKLSKAEHLARLQVADLALDTRIVNGHTTTSDALWDLELVTNKAYFNPCFYTMLGYEPYEMPQSFETWNSLIHPEDKDDTLKKINEYVEKKILKADPFQTLDQEGVGEMVKIAIKNGRKTKKKLEIGICGEHGGDPESVMFCHRVGMNYVSCSPFRVPVARLAAAHAVLEGKK